MTHEVLNFRNQTAVVFSLRPQVNSFSENAILTLPTCVFGHRSDLNGPRDLHNFEFVK
jgi:hypothetical protein